MNHKTNRSSCGVSSLILATIVALSEKLIALAIGSSLNFKAYLTLGFFFILKVLKILKLNYINYLKEDFMKFNIKEESTKDEMKVIGTYVTYEVYFQLKNEAEENFMSL